MTDVRDFREFVLAATPELSRTAYLLTGDHHLAQDLLQSALANTHRHWRRVCEGNPRAYVRKAMHHEQLSWRRRRRVPEVLQPETPEPSNAGPAEQAETRIWLWQALTRLTPRQRSVVVLRFYEDLTEAQTARVLGCSVGSVKRHGHEALARLRETLRAEAERAPAYEVLDEAVGLAKRRRRITVVSAVVAAILVGTLVLLGAPGRLFDRGFVPAGTDGPSIPSRIAAPPMFQPSAKSNAMGPASVLFGGVGWQHLLDLESDHEGDLALVGSKSDVYRVWHIGHEYLSARAGEDVLLSPDGTLVARSESLLDLRTGRLTPFGTYQRPLAWSPDGRTLAIAVDEATVALVGIPDGHLRRVPAVQPGPLAFSPDGNRFAVQFGSEITIYELDDLRVAARVRLPDWAVLAGKGAWTRDGQAVVAVTPGSWRLQAYGLADGRPTGPAWTAGIAGTALQGVRLLGWNPHGEPVVAVYTGKLRQTEEVPLAYANVESVQVRALTQSGAEVLLEAGPGVLSIDVADDAIASGLVRPGRPPVVSTTEIVLILLALALAAWLTRRAIRRR